MHRVSPGLRYSTITLTQVTFLAGTVHLLSAINSPDAPRRFATSLAASEDCQRALREMGQSWKCATQSAEILRRLTEEWCGRSATGAQEGLGGVKRARPDEEEHEKAPMDLHRNLWDSRWGRLVDMERPESLPRLPDLPSQTESSQHAPYVSALPLSFSSKVLTYSIASSYRLSTSTTQHRLQLPPTSRRSKLLRPSVATSLRLHQVRH